MAEGRSTDRASEVFLSVPEVAAELGVSRRLVIGWIDAGKLAAIEGVGRGRGLRISRRALDEFIAARAVGRMRSAVRARERRSAVTRSSATGFTGVRDAIDELLGGRRR